MTVPSYQVREDFDDDGGMQEDTIGFVIPAHEAETWQMNALLGLLAHKSGGRMELDLRLLREIIGKPLAIHFDMDRELAVVELMPEDAKPVTHSTSARRQ